jgi:hypothetical protein
MGVDPGKVEKGIGFRSGEHMAGKAETMGIPINMYIYTYHSMMRAHPVHQSLWILQ